MDRHAVLVFRNQPLDQDQQIRLRAVLRSAGPGAAQGQGWRPPVQVRRTRRHLQRTHEGEVAQRTHAKIVGNVANQLWHSDSSFQRPRAKYSMLSAVVVPPEGGETEFADLRAAYDALPAWRKSQIENLTAQALRAAFALPAGRHRLHRGAAQRHHAGAWPLVQTDPRSGRKILFVGIHACEVEGMTWPRAACCSWTCSSTQPSAASSISTAGNAATW